VHNLTTNKNGIKFDTWKSVFKLERSLGENPFETKFVLLFQHWSKNKLTVQETHRVSNNFSSAENDLRHIFPIVLILLITPRQVKNQMPFNERGDASGTWIFPQRCWSESYLLPVSILNSVA
jgi:hypothetical protein